jgi:GT2 family glycosyltransferase
MLVTAIIVTYNGEKWIHNCLLSLVKSNININILVVDNGSVDQTLGIIKQNFHNVSIVENKQNLGFGKANNIGIRQAYDNGTDYVFLLNQDAWVQENTIACLIEASSLNSEYGIISPIHLNGQGNAFDEGFSKYIFDSASSNFMSDLFLNSNQNKVYPLDFVNAAAWLISKNCIEKIGGFNPTFPHYGEDVNYCQRLKYHGLKVGVISNVAIFHDRENRPRQDSEKDKKINYIRNILVQFSDPSSVYSIDKLKLLYCKTFFYLLLKVSFKKVSLIKTKLKLLSSINTFELEINKEKSKQIGLTFLS